MANSPGIVKAAYVVAFVTAGLTVIALLTSAIAFLPLALIPLIAGIGIKRGRIWSAYGIALFHFANLLVLLILLLDLGTALSWAAIVTAAAVGLGLGVLYLLPGRSLKAAGSERGSAAPWIAVSALCTLPFIFFRPYVIPSGAMANTLLVGDRVFVERTWRPNPARGDIILFRYPLNLNEQHVKRVIGIPGDHIRLVDKGLWLNGHPVSEPYVEHITSYINSYRDNFPSAPNLSLPAQARDMIANHVENGEVVVPPGFIFNMGDNRDNSLDSRYYGFVPQRNIVGEPLMIYWSYDEPAADITNRSAGFDRFSDAILHFPTKTRWARTFRSIHAYPLR